MAKDGETLWIPDAPPSNRRTAAHNIGRGESGPTDAAGTFDMKPVELFKLLLTSDHVATILMHTNAHAASVMQNWNPVNEDEFYAFIGILLFVGAEKKK